jgi:hypothetical protein
MPKKLALYGIVVLMLALVASSAASARTRSTVAPAETSAKAATTQGSLTLHRLLQGRLEWTRKLSRALRFLDERPAAPENGTHTIIDEPDPAGYGDGQGSEDGDQEELPPKDVDGDEARQSQSVGLG